MTQLPGFTDATPEVARPVILFPVPEKYAGPHKIEEIGLIELTLEEEAMASRRAAGDQAANVVELLKQALIEVNGVRVSVADGTADIWLKRFGSPLRQLLVTAYQDIHQPKEGETANFLRGRKIKVS